MLRQVANDVLRNDVMLRINDVALRANEAIAVVFNPTTIFTYTEQGDVYV